MHEDRLTYWLKQAARGTRGEMVHAILADWREERHLRQAGGLVCRAGSVLIVEMAPITPPAQRHTD